MDEYCEGGYYEENNKSLPTKPVGGSNEFEDVTRAFPSQMALSSEIRKRAQFVLETLNNQMEPEEVRKKFKSMDFQVNELETIKFCNKYVFT